MQCGVCGGTSFTSRPVLWESLITEWQLSAAEVVYIDRQQGETCDQCGANLRSIALANALRAQLGTTALLRQVVQQQLAQHVAVLEINEAGTLSPILRKFGGYVFGAYPEVDMHKLPYPDASFDVVIHSDTLEHVINPVHALRECRRVLKPGGAVCFTVPIVVGRMTRDRAGLPKSCHGAVTTTADDLVVHTEFGADAWTHIMEAGFTEVSLHAVAYPAAVAFRARGHHTA